MFKNMHSKGMHFYAFLYLGLAGLVLVMLSGFFSNANFSVGAACTLLLAWFSFVGAMLSVVHACFREVQVATRKRRRKSVPSGLAYALSILALSLFGLIGMIAVPVMMLGGSQ